MMKKMYESHHPLREISSERHSSLCNPTNQFANSMLLQTKIEPFLFGNLTDTQEKDTDTPKKKGEIFYRLKVKQSADEQTLVPESENC